MEKQKKRPPRRESTKLTTGKLRLHLWEDWHMAFPTKKSTHIGTTQKTTSDIKSSKNEPRTSSLIDLYCFAQDNDVDVDWVPMEQAASLSVELPDGCACIAIDPWKMWTLAEETVALGHELGHCMTGSFYNRFAKRDVIQKHENHADKWAIEKLIPVEELDEAVVRGHTELWDLAEYFDVTEEFMRKAVCWYTYGNLETEFYFP